MNIKVHGRKFMTKQKQLYRFNIFVYIIKVGKYLFYICCFIVSISKTNEMSSQLENPSNIVCCSFYLNPHKVLTKYIKMYAHIISRRSGNTKSILGCGCGHKICCDVRKLSFSTTFTTLCQK